MTKFRIGDIVRAQKTEDGREYYGITVGGVKNEGLRMLA